MESGTRRGGWKRVMVFHISRGTALFVLITLAVVLGGALFAYQSSTDETELDRVYATFSCTCCDGSLLTSTDVCAEGYKTRIADLQRSGAHGHQLFVETAEMMGLSQIIDPTLREETALEFAKLPPADHANLTLDDTYVDFGNVSQSNVSFVMRDFTITNTGTSDLVITGIGTSCSCLSVKVIENGIESPSFSRFSDPHGMLITIPPGGEARLRVTYDARVNSFFRGSERRYVYVTSNDPVHPTKQITIDVIHSD